MVNWGLQLANSKAIDCTFIGTEGNPGIADTSIAFELGSTVTGCSFKGATLALQGSATAVVANNFLQLFGQGNNNSIVIEDSEAHTIVGNTFTGAYSAGSPAIVMQGQVGYTKIVANTFYASGIQLSQDGICHRILIASNTFWEGGEIFTDSGATDYMLQGISIIGNDWETSEEGGFVRISMTGLARTIFDINIQANSIYNQENTTEPLIYINGAKLNSEGAASIRVVGNKLSQEATEPAIRISGGSTDDGTVFVLGNVCEGSRGGIHVSDVREAVVKNNDWQPFKSGVWNSFVGQITVEGVNTAIVDGNSALTGSFGDSVSGFGAAIYVSAVAGGSVRDNDVWGENVVADLETAIEIVGPFWVQGNRYQGIHDFSVGSPFDNAIVVTGTGAIIGENGSPVDYSGATAPIVDESARGESALEIGVNSHDVVHGLTFIPQTVLITPYGNQLIWVSDIGATTFTVDRANPTSSRLEFGWLADYESEAPPPRAVGSAVSAGDGVITIT